MLSHSWKLSALFVVVCRLDFTLKSLNYVRKISPSASLQVHNVIPGEWKWNENCRAKEGRGEKKSSLSFSTERERTSLSPTGLIIFAHRVNGGRRKKEMGRGKRRKNNRNCRSRRESSSLPLSCCFGLAFSSILLISLLLLAAMDLKLLRRRWEFFFTSLY